MLNFEPTFSLSSFIKRFFSSYSLSAIRVVLSAYLRLLIFLPGCESWIMKKAEHQRIDAFELWHWRRLLRVPWTARRPNKSNLKEVNPECSRRTDAEAEAPVLWSPDVKSLLIGKDCDAGKD